jgi:hypothetical protein
MIGRPVEALQLWCEAAHISQGPIFRAIDRFERVGARPLSGNSVNEIVKAHCRQAGRMHPFYTPGKGLDLF